MKNIIDFEEKCVRECHSVESYKEMRSIAEKRKPWDILDPNTKRYITFSIMEALCRNNNCRFGGYFEYFLYFWGYFGYLGGFGCQN